MLQKHPILIWSKAYLIAVDKIYKSEQIHIPKDPKHPKVKSSKAYAMLCIYACKATYFFESWRSDGWPNKPDMSTIWDCISSSAYFWSSIILHCASIICFCYSILCFCSSICLCCPLNLSLRLCHLPLVLFSWRTLLFYFIFWEFQLQPQYSTIFETWSNQ